MALWKYAALLVASCLLLLARPTLAQAPTADPSAARELDCAALDCAGVLPGAARFERVEGSGGAAPFRVGYDAQGEIVGWVALSTDVVDIKAYSGKPLVTLVGLTPDGVIAGARVVHHGGPISLVGIPGRASPSSWTPTGAAPRRRRSWWGTPRIPTRSRWTSSPAPP